MSSFRVSPVVFRRLAVLSVACYALLVVTGGAVRLTGSGLGCPDWPACFAHHLTAASSLHSKVEFYNRVVTVAVTVVSIVTFLAALRRAPWRRDLVLLASGLIVGLVAQIVLGGLVVLFKLNPYLVALHFVLTLVVLADALVLHHAAGQAPTPAEPLVASDLVWLSRLLIGTLAVLVSIGTIVTGSGPHAGSSGTKRIDIAFHDIAELHSTVALFLIGLTLATLFTPLHHAKAPPSVQRRARTMLEILFVQGILGYTQYFLHDSSVVIEFHLVGATAAWCAFVTYYLSLHRHPIPVPVPSERPDAAPALAELPT